MTSPDPMPSIQDGIADRIRGELVCCNVYGRINDGVPDAESSRRYRSWHEAGRRHDLCYWGEAAARLAENYKPGVNPYGDEEEGAL